MTFIYVYVYVYFGTHMFYAFLFGIGRLRLVLWHLPGVVPRSIGGSIQGGRGMPYLSRNQTLYIVELSLFMFSMNVFVPLITVWRGGKKGLRSILSAWPHTLSNGTK